MNYQQSLSWVTQVVNSCKTMAHVSGASKLLKLFRKQFVNFYEEDRSKVQDYDNLYNMLNDKRKQLV